jgi:putative membrane protein
MMGFGFVVSRFGLFLRELEEFRGGALVHSRDGSLWFGTALVLMGVIVQLLAALQYKRLVQRLRNGTWNPNQASGSGIAVAIVLALTGIVVAAHLLLLR